MALEPPEEPPWDASFYAAGPPMIDIQEEGFDEFIAAGLMFDSAYESRVAMVIPGITRELREQAQERSPWLYGILSGAHLNETFGQGDEMEGVVHIDPTVWHPVLGGRPVDYGHRIHTQEGRPWFVWTIAEEADRIIQKYGAELIDVVGDVFNRQRAASAMGLFSEASYIQAGIDFIAGA